MGCANSRAQQDENMNNLSEAEVQGQGKSASHQVHHKEHMPSVSQETPTVTDTGDASPRHLQHQVHVQEHSTSSMITHPATVASSEDNRSRSASPVKKPEPVSKPPDFNSIPSSSMQTPTPHSHGLSPSRTPNQRHDSASGSGDHFRPPISRQQSHSKSISSRDPPADRVGIKRTESRGRAVTSGTEYSRSENTAEFQPPDLARPSSKSDVMPAASGRYQPLAPAQPLSVARSEHASARRSTGSSPHDYSLAADPRTNPRPSISRNDDDGHHHGGSGANGMSSHMGREINSQNPRARAAKRQSKQWGAIPPPPAAMTPATHHQNFRQPPQSQYPGGSRTPQGMSGQPQHGWGFAADHAHQMNPMQQRAQTARTQQPPVMYNAPQHHPGAMAQQPMAQPMGYGQPNPYAHQQPPHDPNGYPGMPRAHTYHADPRQQQHHQQQHQQRTMRPHNSYEVPPPNQSPPPQPTPTPPPPGGTPGPPTTPPERHHSTSRKKKKKRRRRLGDRGQISEKAFFEKYWIESGVLGEGSFARVRRITRKTDQMPFALKLIKKKGMSEDDLQALEKEISILQKLHHPNVVEITDFCDTSKRIYMVVEFCEGGDVFSRIIQQSKFSEKEASHVIASVTRGLDHCHANGIVHRDLKPDNLMYLTSDPHSEIKIIDFGLAGDLSEGVLKTPCGTAHYVAPEVLEGTSYGCEADMWSLGVILYMLLCGFPPFFDQTGNHHRLYKIIKRGEYSFPSPYWDEISEDAKDLIRNLLVKNPRERLTAQQALRHPWLMGDLVSEQNFSKRYLTQMAHFNSSRHFTERKLGTEESSPAAQNVSLFSPEWSMQDNHNM